MQPALLGEGKQIDTQLGNKETAVRLKRLFGVEPRTHACCNNKGSKKKKRKKLRDTGS